MFRILLFSILVSLAVPVLSQDGKRLEALKIAYITNKLNLSPEEAQRFWPVYNKYSDEMRQARLNARVEGTTEIQLEENLLNIRKKYNAEFSKALSPEKVDAFYRAEKEFGAFVQKEMERRQLRQQQKRALNQ